MDNSKTKIRILDLLGSKQFTAEVPSSARVDRLIPILVSRMNLPLNTEDGRKINYRFFSTKTEFLLTGDNSLETINAEDNELFICMPENIATVASKPQQDKTADDKILFEAKNNKINLEENIHVYAPIYVPDSKDLRVDLIRGEDLYKLEECRSFEMKFSAMMWTFVGAILGIIINWATANPIAISISSVIALLLFLMMSTFLWTIANDYKKRADNVKKEIGHSTHNARPLHRN